MPIGGGMVRKFKRKVASFTKSSDTSVSSSAYQLMDRSSIEVEGSMTPFCSN